MRYLLDTCVVVSALRSRQGASHLVLRAALTGRLPIVMHYKLASEYAAVLNRSLVGSSDLSPVQVERFIASLTGVAEEVRVRFLWRPNLPDEGDNFIYEIALAASPCTIVTHNVRDFRNPEIRWPGVIVQTPQQVLTGVIAE